MTQPTRSYRRLASVLFLATSTLAAANHYLVHNMVSDLPGLADRTDPNLVNPWGNAFSATSPFWIANTGTGTSTLYDGAGNILSLVVAVPAANGATTPGHPTGVMFNGNTSAFTVATGKASSFLFCSTDGVISGWNSSVDSTHAKVLADNSSNGAGYTGCTLGGTSTAPMLYAADFHNATIDVWDGSMKPVTSTTAFIDPAIPAGFAPFNIANLNGKLYVAYAKQNASKRFDVGGPGNGYVSVFDMSGNLVSHFLAQGALNSPWGMAIAPASFGDFANMLLVGNFRDGKINVYDPATGASPGALADPQGNPIVLPGLWSIVFGNGGRGGDTATLYFAAGLGNGPDFMTQLGSHGLFGSIQPSPTFVTTGITNGASFTAALAPGSWATIKGNALSATTRSWSSTDFSGVNLPTSLDGVAVTVNGKPAPVSYISPTQINFLVPGNAVAGPAQIEVTNNGLTSATLTATLASSAPAFFTIGSNATTKNLYIAATHADNSLLAPAKLLSGVTSTPATEGETIVLYATGLGATATTAPNGQLVGAPLPLAELPRVTIGGLPAKVDFAGLVAPGLYQVNVVIPSGLTPGTTADIDEVVQIEASGTQSGSNTVIPVVNPTT